MPVQASVSLHSIMQAQYEAELTGALAALLQLYSRPSGCSQDLQLRALSPCVQQRLLYCSSMQEFHAERIAKQIVAPE